ncbi:MAG: dehydrogenase, partial [Chloroflexi bacterium]|nr:dehydrogenase [Chloroflexota bacterium]
IVDQAALTWALVEHRIEGAALDVFEKEPPDAGEKLLTLENVILSPHAICWTDECFKGIGRDAFGSVLDVAQGRAPRNVVNRQVLESPLFQAKLARFASR